VSTHDDPYAERKKLTFEQAEGAAPLPSQLQLKEISQELRARLWSVIYTHLKGALDYRKMSGDPYLREPWEGMLRYMHVYRDHGMVDEFKNDAPKLTAQIKDIFENGNYLAIFGWLQTVLRLSVRPKTF
jgi:hypothetical protein